MATKNAPASIRYDFSELRNYLHQFGTGADKEFAELMYEIGKFGEDSMRTTIATSGTPWSRFRKARWGIGKSGVGRIDTGAMYDSVGSRPRFGKNQYQVEVGYLKNKKPYFGMQDQGFTNIWTAIPLQKFPLFKKRASPIRTEGMHALRDARQDMLDEAPRFARRLAVRMSRKYGIKI